MSVRRLAPAEVQPTSFAFTPENEAFADDGRGYPPAVLAALRTGEKGENTPHILGLHVVEQIMAAHGGTAAFAPNTPHGASVLLILPLPMK